MNGSLRLANANAMSDAMKCQQTAARLTSAETRTDISIGWISST